MTVRSQRMQLQKPGVRSWIWVLALCLLTAASYVRALDLDSFPGGLVPGDELILLDDPDAILNFEQARDLLITQGQSWVAPGQPNLGYRQGALWVRVDLNNRFSDERQWIAYTTFTQLSRVDFYYQDAAGQWINKAAGSALPFRARDKMHRSINFEFNVL